MAKWMIGGFVLLIAIVGIVGGIGAASDPASTPNTATATQDANAIPDQGITQEKADELWKGVEAGEEGLVHRWSCGASDEGCTIQINPGLWAQMDYDLKRDVVAGMGKSAAVVHQARHTTFTDAYSGKELARYSAITRDDHIE